jgi:20S proteasome alpha/beta subunit
MTLVTAAHGKDFVVACADSRGTFGDPQHAFSSYDVMQKLAAVSPHVIMQMYGAGEIGDNLLEEFKPMVQNDDGISNIMTKISSFCLAKWQQFFSNVPFELRPVVAFQIAGLDMNPDTKKFDIPRIYTIDSRLNFVPSFHRYGWAAGGIPIFAIYLLGRRYRSNMTLEELCALVTYVTSETATQDLRVGGAIHMKKVLSDGVKDVPESEIKDLLDKYHRGELH